jgi:hypothetical protein
MTAEIPKGLKSKMKHCFQSLPLCDKDFFDKSTKPYELFNLSFSLSFFHSVLKGRMMFGSLGWNTQYEFNDIDFKICIMQLQVNYFLHFILLFTVITLFLGIH